MAIFLGIQVYEILENGDLLNGIYTNANLSPDNGKNYRIDCEIARKQLTDHHEGIEGVYDCSYIESNNTVISCELKITKHNGVYKFVWSKNGKPTWVGLGLMAGTTHIAVSYDGA